MTARSDAQAKHQRVMALVLKPHLDYCNNTFGTAPCTATGTPCYNTYGTCKDKANYAKGVKTPRYCSRGMAIPPGETLRPYILSHTFTPTEIPVGGGLATRSNITFTLADEVCTDYEDDPYIATRATPAKGTYWTRWLARNYNTVGRVIEVLSGYVTSPFDWATFQNELYVIESITGPDNNGDVQFTLSDVVKPLDKNLLPAPTSGKLLADFKAIEYTGYAVSADATHITLASNASAVDGAYTGMECYVTQNTGAGQRRVITAYVGETRQATVATWSVTPDTTSVVEISALSINVGVGNGVQYNDPTITGEPELVCIGNEEIRYTVLSGDVLSWPDSTYRAQFGTAREDHSIDDGVQQCFTVIDKSVTDTIHKLANAAGITDTYLDLAGLAQEDDDWLGVSARLTASFPKPEKASGLLNELLRDLNMASWWNAVAQQQKFKADMPQLSTTVKAITPDETILASMQVIPLDSLRITQAFISFAPYSATGNMTDRQNFRITEGYEDGGAESPNEYNGVVQTQTYSRWLSEANQPHARALVARKTIRFRNAPWRAKLKLDPRDEVHMGDLVDVTTRKKTDAGGNPVVTRMRVVKLLEDGNFDVEAINTTFDPRAAFIAPDGVADFPTETTYAHISDANGLMSDGTQGYTII
ncbi:MAG: hypothetical protein Q7S51_04425 [Gallionellaceae bacterium]|nr:hypothetical protein [Gallionellaceae bacterium]